MLRHSRQAQLRNTHRSYGRLLLHGFLAEAPPMRSTLPDEAEARGPHLLGFRAELVNVVIVLALQYRHMQSIT